MCLQYEVKVYVSVRRRNGLHDSQQLFLWLSESSLWLFGALRGFCCSFWIYSKINKITAAFSNASCTPCHPQWGKPQSWWDNKQRSQKLTTQREDLLICGLNQAWSDELYITVQNDLSLIPPVAASAFLVLDFKKTTAISLCFVWSCRSIDRFSVTCGG